jgi:hypothetical protein
MSQDNDNAQKKPKPPKRIEEARTTSASVLGLTGQDKKPDFVGKRTTSGDVLKGVRTTTHPRPKKKESK